MLGGEGTFAEGDVKPEKNLIFSGFARPQAE
jgi:hypothetical protein